MTGRQTEGKGRQRKLPKTRKDLLLGFCVESRIPEGVRIQRG